MQLRRIVGPGTGRVHSAVVTVRPQNSSCRARRARVTGTTCFADTRKPTELTAVVIGSGFAGLSAAAGLSKRFKEVTLLERDGVPFDALPEEISEPDTGRQRYEVEVLKRQGVSQYKQPHIMLKRGLELVEELFPDYRSKMCKAGALQTDLLKDSVIFDWGQEWTPGTPSQLKCLAASRHLYETVLRTCVAELENVKVQTGAFVTGIELDDSKRVTGVKLKHDQTVQADLIVDASGSTSKTAEWLEQLGHTLPPTMTIDAGLRYTARMYEVNDDPDRGWITAFCGSHPEYNKTAMVMPIETNKWQVLMAGYAGHYCPTDEEGFMEWARTLPSPTIYNALSKAKPITPISTFAKTRNFRRMYEQAPPPKGLCVIGDAACSFNPVMGQGMTVGMMGSHLLCQTIDKQLSKVGSGTRQQQLAALDALPAAFHQELGKMLDYPWAVATGQDARKPNAFVDLPEPGKGAVPAWLNTYLVELQRACWSDHYLFFKLAAVNHMIAPPTVLFMPDVALRLLRSWLGSQAQAMQKKFDRNTAAMTKSGTEVRTHI